MIPAKHLLWRMGFGPDTATWSNWSNLSAQDVWDKLKQDSSSTPVHFDVADDAVKGALMGVGQIGKMERRDLDKDKKRQIKQQSRENLRSLNLLWLEEMTHSPAQLREKMAFFWHGHFASRNINILYQQQLLALIREGALGNFGDLLRAVSKSAAMIAFLNNQQNKKEHPNENFAREVMELFTLGRGRYTETDVKEAARAFTGWAHRLDGDFVFRKFDHDNGEKTIFGQTGFFDGDDVIDMLLKRRETAHFIAQKIYRFFVNESHIPEARIRQLGDIFYDSGYQIMALLDAVVMSAWFYDNENIGAKIKSPIELWVGLRRALPMQLSDPEAQLLLQKVLGQVLFFPPNVAGWPGGRNWIDSGSLMLRLQMARFVVSKQSFDVRPKRDDDQAMGKDAKTRLSDLSADIDWSHLHQLFEKSNDNQLIINLSNLLWCVPVRSNQIDLMNTQLSHTDRLADIQAAAVLLFSTPEYQLC